MDGWLGICNTDSVKSYENKLDSKNDHFGSGLFTNDVIILKHQGACQKLMIGWHKHQGVSETPKNADVICEQPLILDTLSLVYQYGANSNIWYSSQLSLIMVKHGLHVWSVSVCSVPVWTQARTLLVVAVAAGTWSGPGEERRGMEECGWN